MLKIAINIAELHGYISIWIKLFTSYSSYGYDE